MRFNNKLINLYIRYAKESGQYCRFKDCFEKYIRLGSWHKHAKNMDEFFEVHNRDLHFMTTIGFHNGTEYDDCGEKYVFNLYRDKITQEFYNFIHENKIESFFDKIDYRFISGLNMKPISDEYSTKAAFLFEYLAPSSFIIASFLWDETNEGFSFWENVHNKWLIRYRDLLYKLIG